MYKHIAEYKEPSSGSAKTFYYSTGALISGRDPESAPVPQLGFPHPAGD